MKKVIKPTRLMSPLAILGGTFDPVHFGHLHVAQGVINSLPIEEVKFIPSYTPVHRALPTASVNQRVKMLELALQPNPKFKLDLREIERKEPSFMFDTLVSLKQDYPTTPLYLILGADVYQHLPEWKNWQNLLDYAHFVIINRPEASFKVHPHSCLASHETDDIAKLTTNLAGSIYFLAIPPNGISATQIRNLVRSGQSVANLVPTTVAQYINQERLYR